MAECIGKSIEATDPQGQSFASTERQLFLEAVPEQLQSQSILTLAWAILSAAYSEENDATIDVLDPNSPSEIVFVRLHLGAERSIKDVEGEIQQRLHRGFNGSDTETSTGTQETPKKTSSLPKTLLALVMDDGVQGLFLKSDYVLAITSKASLSDHRSLVLRGYYNSSKLDDRDCQDVLDRVGNLVTQIGAGRHEKVGDFNLICASDKERLGVWNKFMPPSIDACVQDLIEHQSKQHPTNEAVCAWDGSFTYEELDRRATVLAKRLVVLGVSIGSYVPLMFEKSKWHIISLLAVRNRPFVSSSTVRV